MRQVSICFSQLLVVFFCPPVANKCCRWFKLEPIKLASTNVFFPTFSCYNFNSRTLVLLLPCLCTFSSLCSRTTQTNLRLTWAQVTPVHPFLTSSVAAVFVLQSAERFQPHWAEPASSQPFMVRGSQGEEWVWIAQQSSPDRERTHLQRETQFLWEIC